MILTYGKKITQVGRTWWQLQYFIFKNSGDFDNYYKKLTFWEMLESDYQADRKGQQWRGYLLTLVTFETN